MHYAYHLNSDRNIDLLSIKELTIYHVPNSRLKNKIFACKNLEVLHYHDPTAVVPEKIGELSKLKKLELSSKIKDFVPKNIGNLAQLEELHILTSKRVRLPDSIRKLSKLRRLKFHAVGLHGVDTEGLFKNLHQLEELSIYDYKFETFPLGILELKNLKKLFIVKSSFKNIPSEINQLKQLEQLSFAYNQLESIPETIKELKNLTEISLQHNPIEIFPKPLLSLRKLTKIDLLGCKLRSLPNKLSQLSDLQELGLDGNPFESYPTIIFDCPKLDFPNFYFTPMDQLAQYIQELQKEAMGKDAYLACCALHENNVAKIKELPAQALFDACRVKSANIRDKAIPHIKAWSTNSLEQRPLQENSAIAFIGTPTRMDAKQIKLQLEAIGITLTKTIKKGLTTHVLVGSKIYKKHNCHKHQNLVFLGEAELIKAIAKLDGSGFLVEEGEDAQQMRENVENLLLSLQTDSILTAMELIKTGGLANEFIPLMIFVYVESYNKREIRKSIREILYKSALSEEAKQHFKDRVARYSMPLRGSDGNVRKLIRRYTGGMEELGAEAMAFFLYRTQGRGYQYILDDTSKETKLKFLRSFIKDRKLDLSKLKELLKLPKEIIELVDEIDEIILKGCNFLRVPAVLSKFKGLKRIDLRNNRVEVIHDKIKKKLPHCEFLI